MTYLIDGRGLQDRSALRGIGTYVRGLLEGLGELGVAGDIEVLLRRNGPVPPEVEKLHLRVARPRMMVTKRRLQPLADPFLIAAALRSIRPSLYHSPDYAQPIVASMPVVITVHDLIPFVLPHYYPWLRRERLLALRLLRRADALLADSVSTARDLVRYAHVDGERIHVVPLAVAAHYHQAPQKEVDHVRARLGLTRPFLLAVGAFDPRKRIDRLASVVAAIRQHHDVDLAIVGDQGNFDAPVREVLQKAGLAAITRHLGYLSTADLVALYSGCECLLFTSEYEGFGLPPLEAMASGAPVALFGNSSLPEVAGDAALLTPDGDVEAMADSVAQLLSDNADQERRRRRGKAWASRFTWKQTAVGTLSVYEQVLSKQ